MWAEHVAWAENGKASNKNIVLACLLYRLTRLRLSASTPQVLCIFLGDHCEGRVREGPAQAPDHQRLGACTAHDLSASSTRQGVIEDWCLMMLEWKQAPPSTVAVRDEVQNTLSGC